RPAAGGRGAGGERPPGRHVPHTIVGQGLADALSVCVTSAYALDGHQCAAGAAEAGFDLNSRSPLVW
ncbi:MAG: hypothetical protein JWN08_898, partial [Frankiales bacterium]|nr:hypothetical protein [Frankiales bacterium]